MRADQLLRAHSWRPYLWNVSVRFPLAFDICRILCQPLEGYPRETEWDRRPMLQN